MSEPDRRNRLALETSPYLRQHAGNPVNWYPWGEEALESARSLDRPILLSIGYSACHWCHVMERESFENDRIAALMNDLFVNIKVDREERPDLDEIYMAAVQAMTGSAGWPMTVFLTPDLRPFYGGTYYPPEDRHGRPGFPRVIAAVADHFRNHRDRIEQQAGRLLTVLQRQSDLAGLGGGGRERGASDAAQAAAFDHHSETFDAEFGGFGTAPKFPHSMGLSQLLRFYLRSRNEHALHMVELTLDKMARGGIYDQLGGGFHRYSVDERWLVPHFEKMLYDNALLAVTYLEAYQVTRKGLYRRIVEETLDYVLREMAQPRGGYSATQDADSEGGGFHRYSVDERWLVPHFEKMLYDNALLAVTYLEAYQVTRKGLYRRIVEETLDYVLREMAQPRGGYSATQDADSEGEEGLFFLWTSEEVERHLPAEQARLFCRYYGVTTEGNFEGKNILHISSEMADLGALLGVEVDELQRAVALGRERLLAVREKRILPARDDKIVVAWDGLMISAMARAHAVLGHRRYIDSGIAAATFILSELRSNTGTLMHSFKDGKSSGSGFQDDYACFINGLVDLYEATYEPAWLGAAVELTGQMVERFWDPEGSSFFFTEEGATDLIVRSRNPFDNSTPSGNSMAALAMMRLGALTGDESLWDKGVRTVGSFAGLLERSPTSFAQMGCALDFSLQTPLEIAVVGEGAGPQPLAAAVHEYFLPNKVVCGWPSRAGGDSTPEEAERLVPLLAGKCANSLQAAYVCEEMVCSPPIEAPQTLAQRLAEAIPGGGMARRRRRG